MLVPLSIPAFMACMGVIYLLHGVFLTILMTPRYPSRSVAVYWIITAAVCDVVTIYLRETTTLEITSAMAYVFTAIVFTGVFFAVSEDPVPKKLFLITIMMSAFTVSFVLGIFAGDLLKTRVATAVVAIGLYVLIIAVYNWGMKRPLRNIHFARASQWWPLTGVVLLMASLITIDTLFLHHAWTFDTGEMVITAGMIAALGLVIMTTFRNIRYMQQSAEFEKEKLQNHLYEYQLEDMHEAEENARRLRHDLRHHNLTIAEYVKAGQYEELLRYLDAYEDQAEKQAYQRFCANDTVNSILSAYIRKARMEHIRTEVSAALEKDLPIQSLDMVAILANVLENAIHGCQASGRKDGNIVIDLREKSGKLVLICENTCAPDVQFDEAGLPHSSRRKGIGVESILSAAGNYDGSVDFHADGQTFTCTVILNLK